MIGVFDSGIGGLRMLGMFAAALPRQRFLYLGDTAGGPYELKSREHVSFRVKAGLVYLKGLGVDGIIVTCPLAASVLHGIMMDDFSMTVLDVNSVSVERAAVVSPNAAIGVIGSHAEIQQVLFERMIHSALPAASYFFAECSVVAPLVEAGLTHKPETRMIVKKCLHPLKTRQIDLLITASNHFGPMMKWIGKKMGKNVRVIDPAAALVEAAESVFGRDRTISERSLENGGVEVLLTDATARHGRLVKQFYGMNVVPAIVRL